MSPGIHSAFNQIVLDGLKRDAGMPAWGDVLSKDDADAIHAYLIDQSRQAYAAQKKGTGGNAGTGIIKGY